MTLLEGLYAKGLKRGLDVVVSILALLVLSPIAIMVAIAVKLDSPGSVLFRQERIGRHGKAFVLYKFRSMTVGAEHRGTGALVEKNDSRITGVGRIIRKLSFDEIPQLINVLRGEMSVVGPRPGLRYQFEQYDEVQRRRLLVRPGVTGWAQVNGRNSIDWGRRIELDLDYVDRLSPWTDALVLLKTFPSVLKGSNMIAATDYWKERATKKVEDAGAREDASVERAQDASEQGGDKKRG
jgi:undecaprenyl phosphate N,N'-diacetylbacillosamine 1-phosphate transferase